MIEITKNQKLMKVVLLITLFFFPIMTFILYFLNEPRMNLLLVELTTLHPLNVFILTGFLFPYSVFFVGLAIVAGILLKKFYPNTVIVLFAAYWIYSHGLIFLWTFGRMYLGWHFG